MVGGALVYRLRVGVDDDANLDASSSLAGSTSRVQSIVSIDEGSEASDDGP